MDQAMSKMKLPSETRWCRPRRLVQVQAWIAILLLLAVVGPLVAGAQEGRTCSSRTIPEPAEGMYDRVLNRAFRVEPVGTQPPHISIVLRFLPSFHPESEIAIRYADGAVSAEHMVATVPFDQLWRKYFCKTPTEGALAKMMAVRRRRFTAEAETAEKWFRDFWKAINESTTPLQERGSKKLYQLDGTRYRLEYQEGLNSLSFEIVGSELGHDGTGDLPLVQWMNSVRKEIEK